MIEGQTSYSMRIRFQVLTSLKEIDLLSQEANALKGGWCKCRCVVIDTGSPTESILKDNNSLMHAFLQKNLYSKKILYPESRNRHNRALWTILSSKRLTMVGHMSYPSYGFSWEFLRQYWLTIPINPNIRSMVSGRKHLWPAYYCSWPLSSYGNCLLFQNRIMHNKLHWKWLKIISNSNHWT